MECYTGWHWSATTASLAGGQDKVIYYRLKRGLDLLVTVLALFPLAPLLLLIALAIKLDTPGPVFFRQERIGAKRKSIDGRTVWEVQKFRVLKFRSMVRDADESLHRAHIKMFVHGTLPEQNASGAKVKIQDDPRITRVGKILRRTSLDELPQLFNVLRGEMSLVGPRPVPEYEVHEYWEAWHHERLATLPGLTGLWQVEGRGLISFEEMVLLDIEYISNQSFWLDLKLLLLTVPAVITGRGAE
jgi:lipopolysaccharide/colanic/teichoic acid biosynthesis glycosyltransferase